MSRNHDAPGGHAQLTIVALASLLAVIGLTALAAPASAQQQSATMIVTTDQDRIVENSTFTIHAKAIVGRDQAVAFQGDDPELSIWAHIHDDDLGFRLFCWDHGNATWLVVEAVQDINRRCEATPDLLDGSHAGWILDGVLPLTDDTTSTSLPDNLEARNLSIQIAAELPSGLTQGNVIQQAKGDIQVVDTQDQLFGHASTPIEIEGLSESDLVQVGAFALFLFWALSNGLSFAGVAAIPGLIDPLIVSSSLPHPGFKASLVLVTIAVFVEFGVRNTFWPAKSEDEQDPFSAG